MYGKHKQNMARAECGGPDITAKQNRGRRTAASAEASRSLCARKNQPEPCSLATFQEAAAQVAKSNAQSKA